MPIHLYHSQLLPWLRRNIRLVLLVIAGCLFMLICGLISPAVSHVPANDEGLELVPAGSKVSARNNCPECGVVSSTRKIAHAAFGDNSGIEVTVRMRDGSMHRFTDSYSSNWHEGERMIVIDNRDDAGE
jgi:hypothetical protein